jgi:hypothetical protein
MSIDPHAIADEAQPRPPLAAYEPGAMRLAQFCQRYNVPLDSFFKLRRAGLGPEEIHVGKTILVTHRAAAAWESMMAARTRAALIAKRQAERSVDQ